MYAPVAWMESLRTILHIGATLNWEINQLDVKTAFLHGDLKKEVWGTALGMERNWKGGLGLLTQQDSVWSQTGREGLVIATPPRNGQHWLQVAGRRPQYLHAELQDR
jgi:hypothetical protein